MYLLEINYEKAMYLMGEGSNQVVNTRLQPHWTNWIVYDKGLSEEGQVLTSCIEVCTYMTIFNK